MSCVQCSRARSKRASTPSASTATRARPTPWCWSLRARCRVRTTPSSSGRWPSSAAISRKTSCATARACGQIVGLPLDRRRPLWEIHLVEGLEGGLQAIVVKMHHAAIDGVSGAELSAAWLDLEADPAPEVDEDDWQSERVPSEVDLLVGAWTQLASSPAKVARTTRRFTEAVLRVSEHNRDSGAPPPPPPFRAPRTSFNLAITPHRRACLGEAALAGLTNG